jgi:hypothetical protein
MKRLLICNLLLVVTTAFAQNVSVKNFVIDSSKPYVYLKFDHIGPRMPVEDGEGDTGIWLRLVNNCRIPIVLEGFMMPEGNPGVGLMDEVVDTEPMFQIANSVEDERKFEEHEQQRKLKRKPGGYAFETGGIVHVQPGKDILFSVPLNHVDADGDWYMRVKFALDLNKSSLGAGPFTYLPFDEWDIPKEYRSAKASGDTEDPRNPSSTLFHESGHVDPSKPR